MIHYKRFVALLCLVSQYLNQSNGAGTCTNPPTGYQWKHDNVYYKKHNTNTNQLSAVLTCQGEGATLAMIKSQDALDAVQSYMNQAQSNEYWVGLIKPNLDKCNSKQNCAGKFKWMDGTTADSATLSHLANMNMDENYFCTRLRNQGIFDKYCGTSYEFVCQYDCDNPFVTETCAPANIGSDFVYNGNYYKKLDNPVYYNYDTAVETCRSEGGTLPTFDTEQNYKDAKVVKGLTTNNMWLGFRAKSGSVCSSPSSCDGKLLHHLPGETSASDDDIKSDFSDGGWINTEIAVDTGADTKMCLTMSNNNYAVQSMSCSDSHKFYCKIPCTVSPSCPMPPALSAEGYEANGRKYYKLYHLAGDKADQFVANAKCQSVGARLAMMKTLEDFNTVRSYWVQASALMYVGLVNDNFEKCYDLAGCEGKFFWVDGTPAESSTSHFPYNDGNSRQYCFVMFLENGSLGDDPCYNLAPFTCQYDCDNPYVEPTCLGTPSGFDEVYNGQAYKRFLDTEMTYDDAQKTCRDLGGALPTINTQEEFVAARKIAAFTTVPMWIGLHNNDSNSGACSSPEECSNNFMWHHELLDDNWENDVWTKFIDEGYVNVGMTFDKSVGSCVVMHAADYTNENQMVSRSCDGMARFVCTVPCGDCGTPEDAGNNMSRDWTDTDDNKKEDAEAV